MASTNFITLRIKQNCKVQAHATFAEPRFRAHYIVSFSKFRPSNTPIKSLVYGKLTIYFFVGFIFYTISKSYSDKIDNIALITADNLYNEYT